MTSTFLDIVKKHFKRAPNTESIEHVKRLQSRSDQYRETRHDKKIKNIIVVRTKTMNKSQLKRGFDYTPSTCGLVPYAPFNRNTFIPAAKLELVARGLEFPEDDGIKKLIAILKPNENTRRQSHPSVFKPITEFQ